MLRLAARADETAAAVRIGDDGDDDMVGEEAEPRRWRDGGEARGEDSICGDGEESSRPLPRIGGGEGDAPANSALVGPPPSRC